MNRNIMSSFKINNITGLHICYLYSNLKLKKFAPKNTILKLCELSLGLNNCLSELSPKFYHVLVESRVL